MYRNKSVILGMLMTAVALQAQVASHKPSFAAPPPVSAPTAVSAATASGKAVARVNGAVLTDRDLLREMFAIFPYARLHNGFPKSMEADIRKGALEMIVFEELVYQEAERRKMTVSEARINRAEADFQKQFSSRDQFNQYLSAEVKGSRQLLRRKIRRSLLIEALLKAEVNEKSTVSEAELTRYYETNAKRFEHGEAFAIQTISFLPPNNGAPEIKKEARRRAEEALRKAKATKNYEEFGLLAEKLSEDDFRVNMGDHHAVDRDKLPPEIVKAALAMQPGQVSDLIQLGDAYTLFRLNAHSPAGKAPLSQVRKQLMVDLQKQKSEQLRVDLNKRLRKSASVELL